LIIPNTLSLNFLLRSIISRNSVKVKFKSVFSNLRSFLNIKKEVSEEGP